MALKKVTGRVEDYRSQKLVRLAAWKRNPPERGRWIDFTLHPWVDACRIVHDLLLMLLVGPEERHEKAPPWRRLIPLGAPNRSCRRPRSSWRWCDGQLATHWITIDLRGLHSFVSQDDARWTCDEQSADFWLRL